MNKQITIKQHGNVETCFFSFQPIMAVFRPGPDHKMRAVFNWAHLAVGVVALFLASKTSYVFFPTHHY